MPKDSSEKGDNAGRESEAQNIPEEVLKQLPPEVKAQLGYVEEQKPIFRAPSGANAGLSDSIDRLREGFEKIGLTLIGRMGEFASTLERVVMTVARIEKVENLTAEITYFLKNLQKSLEGFERNFNKVVDKMDNIEIDIERMGREMSNFKSALASGAISSAPAPITPPQIATPQPPVATPISNAANISASPPNNPAPTTAPSAPQASLTPSATGPLGGLFTELDQKIRAGMNTRLVADILDQAREKISETCKWTPAVYEIGKIARNLRRVEELLSQEDFQKIKEVLDQCKEQAK